MGSHHFLHHYSSLIKLQNRKEASMANANEVKSSIEEGKTQLHQSPFAETWHITNNALVDSTRRFTRRGMQEPDPTSSPALPPAYLQGARGQASQSLPPRNLTAQSIPIDGPQRNQQQMLSNQGASKATNTSATGNLWVLFGTSNLTATVQLAHVEIDKDEIYRDWNFYLALKKKYQAHRGFLRL